MSREELRLHLGCGMVTPDDWVNVDGAWSARLAKHPRAYLAICKLLKREPVYAGKRGITCCDVRRSLRWPDGTFSAVYASHLLEHLYLDDAERLLRECLRVLRPGGVLRLVVPDLESQVRGYATGNFPPFAAAYGVSPAKADTFVRALLMRNDHAPKGSLAVRITDALLDFHSHKWHYDAQSLVWHMQHAGFTQVRSMPCWESRIPGIERIERRDRIEEGAGIAAEGVKPAPGK